MAEAILDLFVSDDESEEFEGFGASDIDESKVRSIGSDISISDIESESSEEEMEAVDDETWSRNLRTPIVNNFSESSGATFTLDRENKEIDFFHHFFPTSLVNNIVIETNAYAQRCIAVRQDKCWTPTSIPEMMAFLGIHVVFSIIGLPTYTLAWKSAWPLEFQSIPSIITRTRFEKISKYFHLNDTN